MKEGEPILGGHQANPGATNTPNPGVQPVSPIVSQNSASTPRPTISSLPRRPQFTPQPQIQPQPISSNTGDIILSTPTNKKGSKKKILLFLIPALVIIIVVILFIIFSNIRDDVDVLSTYDSYAEFVIFGTDGENAINDEAFDIPIDEYALVEQAEGLPLDNEDYFNVLEEKLNKFQSDVNNSSNFKNTDLPSMVAQNKSLLDYYIFSSRILYSDLILISFLNDDGAEISKKAKDILDSNQDNSLLYGPALSLNSYIELVLKRYHILKDFSCFGSTNIKQECSNSLPEEVIESLPITEPKYNALNRRKQFIYGYFKKTLREIYIEIVEASNE